MKKSFNFQNFQPRNEVRSFADDCLNSLMKDLSGLSSCKALISQKEEGFNFSLVVGQRGRFFSSDSFVPYSRCLNAGREWQNREVERLIHDVAYQMFQWNQLTRALKFI